MTDVGNEICQYPAGADDMCLLQAISRGALPAFEEFYRKYHARLSRFLERFLRRDHLVEEVLNDTLMVVWARPDSFHGGSKVSTWVFAIAYRKAMQALRRDDVPVEDAGADERVSPEAEPDEALAHDRRRRLLANAIAELSPHHRAVVDLTYFHEMGYREIAEIMRCPVDTVKTRMFHARRQLRRRLSGELPDWL